MEAQTQTHGFTVPSGPETPAIEVTERDPYEGFLPPPDASSLLEQPPVESALPERPVMPTEGSEPEPTQDGDARPTRKGVPLTKRVSQLTYQKKLLEEEKAAERAMFEQQMQRVYAENQALKTQLARTEQDVLKTTQTTMDQRKAIILNELQRAEEEGNVAAKVKWMDIWNDFQEAQVNFAVQKATQANDLLDDRHYTQEPVTPPPAQPQFQPDPLPPLRRESTNPAYVEWLDETPWMDREHPQFAPGAARIADRNTRLLSEELAKSGNQDQIGTLDFFRAVSQMTQEELGLAPAQPEYDARPAPTNPTPSRVAPVGGVARGGAPTMAEDYLKNNPHVRGTPTRLSSTARDYARSHPFTKPDGTPMTADEAEAEYIRCMNVPVAPGGSPHRFKITKGI